MARCRCRLSSCTWKTLLHLFRIGNPIPSFGHVCRCAPIVRLSSHNSVYKWAYRLHLSAVVRFTSFPILVMLIKPRNKRKKNNNNLFMLNDNFVFLFELIMGFAVGFWSTCLVYAPGPRCMPRSLVHAFDQNDFVFSGIRRIVLCVASLTWFSFPLIVCLVDAGYPMIKMNGQPKKNVMRDEVKRQTTWAFFGFVWGQLELRNWIILNGNYSSLRYQLESVMYRSSSAKLVFLIAGGQQVAMPCQCAHEITAELSH